MKKIIMLLFCLSGYLQGQEAYVEFFGGANFLHSKKYSFKPGGVISGIVGYQPCDGLSLEAEYAFRRNEASKALFRHRNLKMHGYFQSSSFMANGLYKFPYSFLGVGLGVASQKIHAYDAKETKVRFAWQVLAGIEYPTDFGDISLQYKYYQGAFAHIHNHTLGIGLAYYFD